MVSRLRRLASPVLAALFVCSMFAPAVSADTPIDGSPAGAEPRIVGGQQASVENYPYAVYLVNARDDQFCGGVLVDQNSVLTAAHCAEAVDKDELRVVAGRTDKDSDAGSLVDVERVWVHPQFDTPWEGNDVAVLTLAQSVDYAPADIATASDAELYEPGTTATVVGWGRTSEGGPRSDVLRAAELPVVGNAECAEEYSGYERESMVCAGFEEGGVDACQGDSGGPLLVGDTVIGIVSWGRGCARPDSPGIYSRVSNYADEIAAQT